CKFTAPPTETDRRNLDRFHVPTPLCHLAICLRTYSLSCPGDQYMTTPADTLRSSPVTEPASSEARKATVRATSSGETSRCSGEGSVNRRRASSSLTPSALARLLITCSIRSPSIPPGDTRLTRKPCGPTSWASVRVRPTSADLLAAYAVRAASGRFPVIEPILTIVPLRRLIMSGRNVRQARNTPRTLTANVS